MHCPLPNDAPDGASKSLSLLQSLAILLVGLVCVAIMALPGFYSPGSRGEAQTKAAPEFHWEEVEPGYSLGRYELGQGNKVLKPEVFLLRFDPQYFSLQLIQAADFGEPVSDLRSLTLKAEGICGINAHFFDDRTNPLGLLIKNGELRNHMHRGGKLLTGVFFIASEKPSIVKREDFVGQPVEIALQAGPRLVTNGRGLKVKETDGATRRSGIAITRTGRVIIYATFLRFPGATLQQIQEMLLDPRLEIVSALNLDGGGSSQLFVRKNHLLVDDTFITGGDKVPVGLVVKHR